MSVVTRAMRSSCSLAIGAVTLLAVWQLIVWSGIVPDEYFPGLDRIFAAFVGLCRSGELPDAERLTLFRTFVGLGLSCLIGGGLALLSTSVPVVRYALAPLVSIFQVLPPAALVPLAIFFLGFGEAFFLFIVCFAASWPVYLSAVRALTTIEPLQMASARSLGYAPAEILWAIRIPAAIPEMFTGIRLAAGLSLIATVAAEMLASRNGLGFMLFDTAFSLRVEETFAVLFVVAVDGLIVNAVVVGLRRLLAGWNDGLRATA